MDNYSVIFSDFFIHEKNVTILPENVGWYIVDVFGLPYAGPYKREKDAKGQLTRLRKGYTPAARKL